MAAMARIHRRLLIALALLLLPHLASCWFWSRSSDEAAEDASKEVDEEPKAAPEANDEVTSDQPSAGKDPEDDASGRNYRDGRHLEAEEDPAYVDKYVAEYPSLVSWFRSHGGAVDDRVTIGYMPHPDPSVKIRGMIATEDIPAGTQICHAPASLMISGSDRQDSCTMVAAIVDEIELGEQSRWFDYIKFDDSVGSRIPSVWQKGARAVDELQGLPPAGETRRHMDWYRNACIDGEEPTDAQRHGLLMYLTRASDRGLIPIYDLLNHHNGLINTRLVPDDDGGLAVVTTHEVKKGRPVYNTYARSGWESSVDVFNTYGFVEDFPQLWRWNDDVVAEAARRDPGHANNRYGRAGAEDSSVASDRAAFAANSDQHEILVVTPRLAAIAPTQALAGILGNGQRTIEEWEVAIGEHHANLRQTFVNEFATAVRTILDELPTTIQEDMRLIKSEKAKLEKVRKIGRNDVYKADAVKAMEYRLAFKMALRLGLDVAEKGRFLVDSEEL